jgi:hypothetical protein
MICSWSKSMAEHCSDRLSLLQGQRQGSICVWVCVQALKAAFAAFAQASKRKQAAAALHTAGS